MGYSDYLEQLFKIKIFIEGIELNKKQKRRFIDLVYIKRSEFLFVLLKSISIFQISSILGGYLLKKPTPKNINDLISKQMLKQFNSFEKYQNGREIKIEDPERKIIFKTTNTAILRQICSCYYESILVNQYNVSSEKIKNKIVIDAGSNLGEFAIYCARLGAKKVYAFEPATETFKLLEKQIEMNNLNGKVIPIKMALGDKNETSKINFNESGDLSAGIEGSGPNSEIIKVVKLDDFCKKEKINKVSFIKMDVEGYEENVLRGAVEIIKRNKPILSFSAYHKSTDKTVLPAFVLKLRADYKITLLNRAEEDFYCE